MTMPADVLENMRLILRQCYPNKALYRTNVTGGKLHNVSQLRNSSQVVPLAYETAEFVLSNQQVDLLKRLYARCPPDVQQQFASTLIAELNVVNSHVVAQTLVELREVSQLHYWERTDDEATEVWQAIADKLTMEHSTFSDEDLAHVESGMNRTHPFADAKMVKCALDKTKDDYRPGRRLSEVLDYHQGQRLAEVLTQLASIIERVRYIRLRDDLMNVQNPAIDTDRRELLSRIDALGFTPKLSEALHEIERRSAAAATALDFKSTMDLLRTVFEEFIEEAAKKVAPKAGTPLPSGPKISHFASFKDYLRNVGIIGREEEELLQRLYNYLSNQGSHVLGSAPEQFHVSKTTVIEWCLMIAGRVQAYLK